MSDPEQFTAASAEIEASANRSLVLRAAGLVGAALMLSRLLGLLREMVTRSLLGVTTVDATAYSIAKVFPEAIFLIIAGGAIGSAFIPTFSAYFTRDDPPGAWRLFSAIINLVTMVVTAVALVAAVFAPQIVTFFYGDVLRDQPELLPLTVRLMRVMLLSPIIFGASGVIMGALNARQHFLLPALAPSIYNLGIIGGALIAPYAGVSAAMGLAAGTVAGALGHLLVQLPGLFRYEARYTPLLTVRDPGVRRVLVLMAPRVLGLSFSQLNWLLILYLTGSMALGSLPALEAAFRLIILPQGILGQALAIAAFPTLATLAAQGALPAMRRIVLESVRLLLFLGVPVTIMLMLLREPVIVVLFQRGLFGAESTQLVAEALLLMAPGLIALLLLEVIARSFYALSDTLTPVLAGGVQVLLMALLSVWLRDTWFAARNWEPLGALALGFSLSNLGEVLLLWWLLQRKLGRLDNRALLENLARVMLAGALMAGGMWLATRLVASTGAWVHLIVGGVAGMALYIVASWLLRIPESRVLTRLVPRRWR